MKTAPTDPRWRIGKREGEVMKHKQPHFTNISFLPFRKTSPSLAQVHFLCLTNPYVAEVFSSNEFTLYYWYLNKLPLGEPNT